MTAKSFHHGSSALTCTPPSLTLTNDRFIASMFQCQIYRNFHLVELHGLSIFAQHSRSAENGSPGSSEGYFLSHSILVLLCLFVGLNYSVGGTHPWCDNRILLAFVLILSSSFGERDIGQPFPRQHHPSRGEAATSSR